MRAAAVVCLLLLAGCISSPSGSGVRFYNPSTWFSTSEAKKAEKLDAKATEARENLIKEAQKSAHETSLALDEIPASNAKETAQESNEQTVTLLDQAAGPLTADELASIRRQVTLLLSNNADLRRQGEALRQESRRTVEKLSRELADLQSKLDAANQALPDALRREAALANRYRTLIFGFWALVLVAVLGSGVALYLKVMYGGMPKVIGGFVSKVYDRHPEQAANLESLMKETLSPSQIKKIFGHSA